MCYVSCHSFLPQTTTTAAPCPIADFNRTSEGCFSVATKRQTWTDAEATCQSYGCHVHLATLDTEQVGTFYIIIF